MTDPELELAAARAIGEAAHYIVDGVCMRHVDGETIPWRPLTDWSDTKMCWTWLRARFGAVIVRTEHDMDGEPYRVVVLDDPFSPDDVNHNIPTKTESDQEAIVRAVIAVAGGEHG